LEHYSDQIFSRHFLYGLGVKMALYTKKIFLMRESGIFFPEGIHTKIKIYLSFSFPTFLSFLKYDNKIKGNSSSSCSSVE